MLTQLSPTLPEKLLKLAPLLCRASIQVECALRAGGKAITSGSRDELLAKCAAGEYVELEIDLLAFEQKPGEQNRNCIRFRDGAMMAFGRTGVGKPFLRDHEQWDSMARAGTVTASATEKIDGGGYAIRQTAKLTAPWAVELALRGLMTTISIGWVATGPVLCSACGTQVFDQCWHYPGQRLTESVGDDGVKRKLRKADGEITVEWIYTAAELVETSSVPVPAVPTAAIDEIRAALSAHVEGFSATSAHVGDESLEENEMKNLAALVAILGLSPTSGEDDAIKAAENVVRERDASKAELAIANKELAIASKELAVLSTEKKKTAEDKFVSDAILSGRITLGQEAEWREFYQLSSERAEKRMVEKPAGSATPVGQPRQAGIEPAEAKAPAATAVRTALTNNGVNPDQAIGYAKMFGSKSPEKTMAKALGLNEEV